MGPVEHRLSRVAYGFNRRAKKAGIEGVMTGVMLAKKPGECFYCHIKLDIRQGSWDHVVPFSKGGPNTDGNVVRCCVACQRKKHTKSPVEYEESRSLVVRCALPTCEVTFTPRYGEYRRGDARYHSRSCAAKSRWVSPRDVGEAT